MSKGVFSDVAAQIDINIDVLAVVIPCYFITDLNQETTSKQCYLVSFRKK